MRTYSNFRNLRESDGILFAEVDEHILWIFHRRTRAVYRGTGKTFWRFLDSGQYTPDYKVDFLAETYEAKEAYERAYNSL